MTGLLILRNSINYDIREIEGVSTLVLHCLPDDDAVAVIFQLINESAILQTLRFYGNGVDMIGTTTPMLRVLGDRGVWTLANGRPQHLSFENFSFASGSADTLWLVAFLIDLANGEKNGGTGIVWVRH